MALAYFFLSFSGTDSSLILIKAFFNPGGYLVSFTAVASAPNSLFLEIANETKFATIGARMAKNTPSKIKIICSFPFSSFPPLLFLPENHKLLRKISAIIEINPTSTATVVINRMS